MKQQYVIRVAPQLSAKVPAFLDKYRIGVLADYAPPEDQPDFYASDPVRPPTQLVLSDRPWSSETDVEVYTALPACLTLVVNV